MIVSLYCGLYVCVSSNCVSGLSSSSINEGSGIIGYCIVRLLFQKVFGLVLRSILGAFRS